MFVTAACVEVGGQLLVVSALPHPLWWAPGAGSGLHSKGFSQLSRLAGSMNFFLNLLLFF